MPSPPVVLGSDTLSELSRGNPTVTARAQSYLQEHGGLTITAISVFERLRGYRVGLRAGKPFGEQLRQFQGFVATCRVLPVNESVAAHAAVIWAALGVRRRKAVGDILIAATASAHALPLATRNRRDFEPITRVPGVQLALVDWTQS
jgi:predicted nucleic acid-binding protein